MRNEPSDGLRSVDSALVLLTALHQEGAMRVTDAASRLEVSVSTAHRLLTALVRRGFAEHLADRRYGPGWLPQEGGSPRAEVARLREAALPGMRRLVDAWEETVNLNLLVQDRVRFVATVECRQLLRVGDRTGRTLPAHLSSGGKAMLAMLSPAELESTLRDVGAAELKHVREELRSIRRRGYALNDQQTETGVTAIGVALPRVAGMSLASIALAMPAARFSTDRLAVWSADLTDAARDIAEVMRG